jgi:hypothetical protein
VTIHNMGIGVCNNRTAVRINGIKCACVSSPVGNRC